MKYSVRTYVNSDGSRNGPGIHRHYEDCAENEAKAIAIYHRLEGGGRQPIILDEEGRLYVPGRYGGNNDLVRISE